MLEFFYIIMYTIKRCLIYPGVAKFGIALGSGPRGRGFKSRHSDHQAEPGRMFAFGLIFCFTTLPAVLVLRLITAEIYVGSHPYNETVKYFFIVSFHKITPLLVSGVILWLEKVGTSQVIAVEI